MTCSEIIQLQSFIEKLGAIRLIPNSKELPELIAQGLPEFDMEFEDVFEEGTQLFAKLHFFSNHEGKYYLLRYAAHLRYLNDPSKDKKQVFFMGEMKITLREAFNLLQGRCVEKEITKSGEKYISWIRLNFSDIDKYGNYRYLRFRSEFRYDLDRALDFYPGIMETNEREGKAAIISSLKQGNRELVTIIQGSGKAVEKFIEANPKTRTLKIYDPVKVSKKISTASSESMEENDDAIGSTFSDDEEDFTAMGSRIAV